MVAHVLKRLQPQVQNIVINANRNLEQYRRFGLPVIPDPDDSHRGPLVGIATVMENVESRYFVSVPCDAPFFPMDLILRLREALKGNSALCSVACWDGSLQPVFALFRKAAKPAIEDYLRSGERKVGRWHQLHHSIPVEFADLPNTFFNINTEEQLHAVEEQLKQPPETGNRLK